MQRSDNNTTTSPLLGAVWQKSRHSNPCGSCVELAQLADGRIAVRNSRHPAGPTLICPRAEMATFLYGAKTDEFDDTTGGAWPEA